MSILDRCAGGTLLEKAVPRDENEVDLTGFADELIANLSNPQRQVYDSNARFKMLCSGVLQTNFHKKDFMCLCRFMHTSLRTQARYAYSFLCIQFDICMV